MAVYELLPVKKLTKTGEIIEEIPKLVGFITRDIPIGVVDGKNTTFVLKETPVANSEHIYLNGLLQEPGADKDYTISGNLLIFCPDCIPQEGDLIYTTFRYLR
jgi:hypothetical protein